MVNHGGSSSPLSMEPAVEPMTEIEKPQPNGVEEPQANGVIEDSTPMLVDGPSTPAEPKPEPEIANLPTPSPSSSEPDDFHGVFDLPSDVIYASVNELPKVDGSSFSQLPLYGPPALTDERYSNTVEDYPIVPISKFCLQRHEVAISHWEAPNPNYRELTPDDSDEPFDVSKEVRVESGPGFAPAGIGMSSLENN
jgi:hypothetical protein